MKKKKQQIQARIKKETISAKIKNLYFTHFDRYLGIVLLISLIILISHTLYIFQTYQTPEMDEQHYMEMATGFYKLLQNPSTDTPVKMIEFIPFRQPGYSFIILPFLIVFGLDNSYKWGLWVNGLLYVTTILGVYFLAKEFLGKKWALVASFIFTTYGWSLFYLHFTYSETATTCFVTMSLLFLAKSKLFTRRNYSILFALTFGYGIFVRWVTPLFVGGPLIFVLYQVIRQTKEQRNKSFNNIILIILLGIIPGSIPYVLNASTFFGDYFKSQALGGVLWTVVPKPYQHHLSLQSAAYYFKVFEQLTFFFFALFVAGFIASIIHWKKMLFILLAFLLPYLAFSFGTIIKDDRYIVPLYPILAILSASIFLVIPQKIVRISIVFFIVVYGICNFLGGVWAVGPMNRGLASVVVPMPLGHARTIHFAPVVWAPTQNVAKGQELLRFIEQDSKKSHIQDPLVVTVFSYRPVDLGMYSLNEYHRLKPIQIDNFVGANYTNYDVVTARVQHSFENANYIVIKSGIVIDNHFGPQNYALLDGIFQSLGKDNHLLSSFKMIKRIYVPLDKSKITIYKKEKKVDQQELSTFTAEVAKVLEKKSGLKIPESSSIE
ncbi:MAG TPA: glycosyltransferase family 39 protein [Candidatus Saccharimonadales bacterium]|nr:glycosyltransferase family 39 protein [Candidatus Saccharimonadales bacterium]